MDNTEKRKNVPSKTNVYMAIAKLISKRSKDPNTQVGAVIVSLSAKVPEGVTNPIPISTCALL